MKRRSKIRTRCQQIHKNLWKKRWSLVCYKWCRVVDIVGIWWYMVGMFSRDVKCAKSKRCGFSFLEVRCMDLGEDMVHPWFARFCKHNFDVSEMCVCVFSLSKQCWKACLKTSRCIQSYGLWTCWIRIRVVLVPTLMVLLQSSWYPAHRRPWTEIHILAKGGWVGWAGNINVHVPWPTYVDATLLLRHWAWVGWGGY